MSADSTIPTRSTKRVAHDTLNILSKSCKFSFHLLCRIGCVDRQPIEIDSVGCFPSTIIETVPPDFMIAQALWIARSPFEKAKVPRWIIRIHRSDAPAAHGINVEAYRLCV